MSILSLPRIHFKGSTDWNPSTANNHIDVYDETAVEPFLQSGVTYATFAQWLKTLNPGSKGSVDEEVWGSWNVYGDHGVSFTNASISGIQPSSGDAAGADPLLGCAINIYGLQWTAGWGPARLVMTDPFSYGENTSQIFYQTIVVGNPPTGGGNPPIGFSAQGTGPMFSKWGYPNRNLGLGMSLIFEAGRSCCWWAGLAHASIQWFGLDQSRALRSLKAAAEASGNQGLVMRFASYFTRYYVAASWKGNPIRSGADLVKAYGEGFTGSNPARSRMLGSIGIWEPGELSSAATDLPLTPSANAVLIGSIVPVAPFPLGPAMAKIDSSRNVLVLDLINAIPEADATQEKVNLGTLKLYAGSSWIADIPLSQYNQTAYEDTAGILEFPIPAGVTPSGPITLVQQQPSGQQTVLSQTELLAETDDWGIYLDQGQTKQLTFTVMQNGAPAPSTVSLLLAQYNSRTNQLIDGTTGMVNDVVTYLDANGKPLMPPIVPVTGGKATFGVQALQSGACTVGVFPFIGKPPALPQQNFPFPNYFYFCVRVLPFDDELDTNTTDNQLTWSFIYSKVLRVFDLIYPAMSQVRNLDSLPIVEGMAVQIQKAVSLDTFQSTLYMPITRDLSRGKRNLLLRFINQLPMS